ncbi:MAG TPA: glycosyltransferase family 4 protein [Terracidiphilus sp.]
MPKRVLLIHQAFTSKDDAGGTRHFELGKRLVAQGDSFTVVTSDTAYLTGEKVNARKSFVTATTEDGIRILRTYTLAGMHKTYTARVFAFLGFMVLSVAVGLCSGRPDLVMGTTPPIFQAVSAWILSVLFRRPFLLEVRDLWPAFAIDIGLLKNPVLIGIARFVENFLYARADHILVNSPAYRDYLIAKGIARERISFIANGVDPAMFVPNDDGGALRAQFGLEREFVCTYAGAIGMANDIDVVVEAAEYLKDRADIRILIVGDGKERKRLAELVRQRGLKNVIFTGSFPKSQMHKVLAASDACIGILRNIPMFKTTYPNKIFDYMAASRPTLLAIDGVIREVVEAAHGGIYVCPGDPLALAKAIRDLADNPGQAREMGANARKYVIEHFNRDDQARAFVDLISSLSARPFACHVPTDAVKTR